MQSELNNNPFFDPTYEFCAPHFFDFCNGETPEEAAFAEQWFHFAPSHPISPFVGKVKLAQEMSKTCSLEQYIEVQKLVLRVSSELPRGIQAGNSCVDQAEDVTEETVLSPKAIDKPPNNFDVIPDQEAKEEAGTFIDQVQNLAEPKSKEGSPTKHNILSKRNYSVFEHQSAREDIETFPRKVTSASKRCLDGHQKMDFAQERQAYKKQRIEVIQRPHGTDTTAGCDDPRWTLEKQTAKKQKLDGGHSCQVYRPARSLTVPQEFHFNTEKRALIHKETGQCSASIQVSNVPYIPVAEMLQRFQMNLLGDFRTQEKTTISRNRALKLTRPKEPRLGTSLRARPPTIKSSAELEEEMLANLPKFKARPLNKRILEAPTLPLPHRSTPQMPEFQEFNLRTMKRALLHQQPPSSVNGTFFPQDQERMTGELHLEMAQPLRNKSNQEPVDVMASKFKARPLDKRIFSSRGDVGLFTVTKRQTTVPKEFHFATDQRAHHHEGHLHQHHKEFHCATDQRAHHHEGHLQQHHKDIGEQNARISTSYGTSAYTGLQVFNDNHHSRAHLDAVACQTTPSSSLIPLRSDNYRRPLGEIQQFSAHETRTLQQTKSIKMKNGNVQEERNIFYHRKHAFYAEPNEEPEIFPVHTRPTNELLQHVSPQAREQFSQNWSFPVHFMR